MHQRVLYCDLSDITNHRTDKEISPEKNRLLVPKEALIGEHNLKPLLFTKKALIGSLLGNKPVITQVHSYDILVINTYPRIHEGYHTHPGL